MSDCAVAYVPVLHDGYRRFIERHATGVPLYLIGPELYEDYRPLAKDIRALPPELAASAIAAWEVCSEVRVLDARSAGALAEEAPSLVMPAEDVSYQVAERFFSRCEVMFDTVFLRWDKTRTTQMLIPQPRATIATGELVAELGQVADEAAMGSIDWWRQVGAAMRLSSGETMAATNVHNPHPLSPYAAGDPRANLFKGVGLELSTATHAEARLIADAAREGHATEGATLFVTDFPCPPCAKLIAGAGIAKLYFIEGYAVLDGQDVLEGAGVEIVQVA
ncbi:MAG TPA: deaminase [Solirubrobacteraceae bacterium]|jgi:dCMP deaminase